MEVTYKFENHLTSSYGVLSYLLDYFSYLLKLAMLNVSVVLNIKDAGDGLLYGPGATLIDNSAKYGSSLFLKALRRVFLTNCIVLY